MQASIINKPFVGLVLAGGLSSRMGTDKAELIINGQSLLEKNKALLTQLGAKSVLVSGKNQGQIADKHQQAGPLAGIHAALEFVPQNYALMVVPVDMPKLTPELLNQLIQFGCQQQCSCYFEQHFLPVYFYDVAQLKAELNRIMQQSAKQRSVRAVLKAVDATEIKLNEPAKIQNLINVNTQVQWQAYIDEQTNKIYS
ncbi:molybdenum cofactor guanylyltransferase [Catenovulum sp. 2E275]|uniref:molybdenum cofactor guanylyltransferase n=1 Tax=Catenovulum sp. 2E275 TaxID=2980497 RepID=UPI0021D3BC85|nr:molybdenum cofactor guanylyltransferase [Catenovulum sp. 2E275]MCU4674347.1 molybdenum cofactor guanylyltransferase [Catenovulum sp. 2E275]